MGRRRAGDVDIIPLIDDDAGWADGGQALSTEFADDNVVSRHRPMRPWIPALGLVGVLAVGGVVLSVDGSTQESAPTTTESVDATSTTQAPTTTTRAPNTTVTTEDIFFDPNPVQETLAAIPLVITPPDGFTPSYSWLQPRSSSTTVRGELWRNPSTEEWYLIEAEFYSFPGAWGEERVKFADGTNGVLSSGEGEIPIVRVSDGVALITVSGVAPAATIIDVAGRLSTVNGELTGDASTDGYTRTARLTEWTLSNWSRPQSYVEYADEDARQLVVMASMGAPGTSRMTALQTVLPYRFDVNGSTAFGGYPEGTSGNAMLFVPLVNQYAIIYGQVTLEELVEVAATLRISPPSEWNDLMTVRRQTTDADVRWEQSQEVRIVRLGGGSSLISVATSADARHAFWSSDFVSASATLADDPILSVRSNELSTTILALAPLGTEGTFTLTVDGVPVYTAALEAFDDVVSGAGVSFDGLGPWQATVVSSSGEIVASFDSWEMTQQIELEPSE